MSVPYKQTRRRFRSLAKKLGLDVRSNVASGPVGNEEGINRAFLKLELHDSGRVDAEIWRFLGDPVCWTWEALPSGRQVESLVKEADASAIIAVVDNE